MKKRGAEAVVELEGESVVKSRVKKGYRHPDLDGRLREQRTDRELSNMKEARKAGVNVPEVRRIDGSTLEMERLEGEEMAELMEDNLERMEELGSAVAKLHGAGIVHGDLTLRNVLVADDLYLIDFGLSRRTERTEDFAVDLQLLKNSLEANHPGPAEDAWSRFIDGYRGTELSEDVLERRERVESRGRYS